MCETFFGLKRRPFLLVPDAEAYISVESMEETRQEVERTIHKGEGIALVFGASGTGKTLLMQIIRQSLETEYTVVPVSHSRLETPKDLFLQLFHDLRLSPSGGETVELRLQLLDFVRKEAADGVVLLFDDAQHLSPAVLEELRLLTDPASGSVPLFRAVLAGTMDFEEQLTLPNLEAFNQRVASRCYLDSFSGEETSRYIHRQTDALRIDPPHSKSTPLFTEDAKRRIYQLTDGVPRLINQLCWTAMQFAADRKTLNIDGSLVNNAWTSFQHIQSNDEAEQIDSSTVQESVISPEQIEEIIDRKRETFQLRQFNPVEFGTLTDSETVETEVLNTHRSFHENEYKPPYPEDDDEETAELEEAEPEVYRLPSVSEKLHEVPEDLREVPAKSSVVSQRDIALDHIYWHHHQFRRRYLLQQIRHRLGLFASILRKIESPQPEQPVTANELTESNMNGETLQEYGAAVLDGRPPFVRKEPHYAYQTVETEPKNDVIYPDPKTGVPITLRWIPEKMGNTDHVGVSYTEFMNRKNTVIPTETKIQAKDVTPVSLAPCLRGEDESAAISVFRTSLNASQGNQAEQSPHSGVEESFEESHRVGSSTISLAELFRIEESTEFKSLDATVQRQLETAIRRIVKAAEKIEQAAEMSEQAGRHVSQAAVFVETEVKSAIPVYTDLFQQWSEFQNLITTELESARQRSTEPLKFQTFPRSQVMIERSVATIDVESLLR